MIKIEVLHQKLNITYTKIVSDTINYLAILANFSNDWDGTEKYIHFTNKKDPSISFQKLFVNDRITREDGLDLTEGEWIVSIHGETHAGGVTTMRITTESKVIKVEKSGIIDGEPFPEITPSIGEQVIATANNALEIANDSKNESEAAKSLATTAEENSRSAVETSQLALDVANDAKQRSQTASAIAGEAINAANSAVDIAASAQQNSSSAVVKSESSIVTANEAKILANQAINAANNSETASNIALNKINSAVNNTEQALENIDNLTNKIDYAFESGQLKGEKGDPFSIAKIYHSIQEMERGYNTDNVPYGSFVLIDSNVEDPDNAKIFVKGSKNYEYVTDMSGATGITGPKGQEGFSPIAKVNGDLEGAIITITDKSGTTSARIKNGVPGPKGDAFTYEDFTPEQIEGLKVKGDDGFSPEAIVEQVPEGAKITIIDKYGETTATIEKGKTPILGVDYYTEEDQETIINEVTERALDEATFINSEETPERIQVPTWEEHQALKEELSAYTKTVKVAGTVLVKDDDGAVDVPAATSSKSGVIKTSTSYGTSMSSGFLIATTIPATSFVATQNIAFVSKATLNNVLATPSIMPTLTAEEQDAACLRIGAVREKPFELIETITTEAETAVIERKLEPNGKAYNFKNMRIEIGMPITGTQVAIADVINYGDENPTYMHKNALLRFGNTITTNKTSFITFDIICDHGEYKSQAYILENVLARSANRATVYSGSRYIAGSAIDALALCAYVGSSYAIFPAGMVVNIYGERV